MADVKLLASQRLTDNPDGGGLMTSTEIVDGVVNNLWPDISRVDRAYGVVNLRKLYMKAVTPDTALYSGLHVICLFPPQDPRVTVTMFSTNSWSDVRSDAQSAVERYLDASVPSRMIPFDRQLIDQRTVLVYQRPELDLPSIGEVYALCTTDDVTTEFFRVLDIDHSVQTFTDASTNQDFSARVITLTISEPLKQTFQGSLPNKFFIAGANTSKVRNTIASDAVNYHGVHSLAADAAIGDLTVKLDSVYTQLVPSSTSESAILDASPAQSVTLVQSGTALQQLITGVPTGTNTRYAGTAITPGTLQIKDNGGFGTWQAIDDGAGNIVRGTSLPGSGSVGTVDYVNGACSIVGFFNGTGSFNFFAIPAAAISKLSQTFQLPVTQSTRGYVYVASLKPIPTPGNLQVSFRALGRWYTLTDDGSGALTGDVGIGTGQINYATGTVSVTLVALPDIGSSVCYAWGGDSEYEVRVGDVAIETPIVAGTLAHNATPGTVSITWTAGGVGKTATDSNGFLTGDATGTFDYATATTPAAFRLKPALLPDPTTTFSVSYNDQGPGSGSVENFTPTASSGLLSVTVAGHPIRPGSLYIIYTCVSGANSIVVGLRDDGNGHFIDANYAHALIAGAAVNYTTGVITGLPASFALELVDGVYTDIAQTLPQRTIDPGTGYYSPTTMPTKQITGQSGITGTYTFVNGTNVEVEYSPTGATVASHVESFVAPPISVDLTPLVSNSVVPTGVMITFGGRTYLDRAGSLYYGIDPVTNAGTLGGAIDYTSGVATFSSWVGGASPTLTMQALLTQVGELPISVVTAHTPGSPLRPSSFYIQANQLDGTLISATADVDGNIATSAMHGYVDVTTGVYSVAFGAYVLDSSLTSGDKAEPWYDSGNVQGDGYIWRPKEVHGSTIRYNAVVEVSTPLDSTILGIDPVRLPLDGRVQAVRNGYMLILHDSQVYTMPGGLTAGQVVSLPRGDLALVEMYDSSATPLLVPGQVEGGATVTGALYTVNLTTGVVTMATPLDLIAYTQPLIAKHRIEDASVVTDVQITGQVTIADALTHAYTASNSLASTALIAPFVGGSVQAAYNHLFSQQTWDNAHPNWTDAVIGAGTTAAFNELDYPIQVLNRDAITEKWAIIFTSGTAFNIVAEDLGVIGTGNTSTDVEPINPATGFPYFLLDHRGFGAGWAAGNAIRFDTQGAGMPVWLARTIKSGPASFTDDRNVVEPRWDKS